MRRRKPDRPPRISGSACLAREVPAMDTSPRLVARSCGRRSRALEYLNYLGYTFEYDHQPPRWRTASVRPIPPKMSIFPDEPGLPSNGVIVCTAMKMTFGIVNNNENTMDGRNGKCGREAPESLRSLEKRGRGALQQEQWKRRPETMRNQSNNNPEQSPMEPQSACVARQQRLRVHGRAAEQACSACRSLARAPAWWGLNTFCCLQIVADSSVTVIARRPAGATKQSRSGRRGACRPGSLRSARDDRPRRSWTPPGPAVTSPHHQARRPSDRQRPVVRDRA